MQSDVQFFATPADLRRWFAKHARQVRELWVGYYKVGTGRPSVTWPESVDEALCVGWIDGVRKSLGESSYSIRFSPRRPGSVWSAVNIKRAQELISQGRMKSAGLKAFEARKENRSGIYSYEQRGDQLPEPYGGQLRSHRQAWEFFQAQPASYRKAIGWWVVCAKLEATRLRRLAQLIEVCTQGRRMDLMKPTR